MTQKSLSIRSTFTNSIEMEKVIPISILKGFLIRKIIYLIKH